MHVKRGRVFGALLVGTLALAVLLLGRTLLSDGARQPAFTACVPLTLAGAYTLDGAAERLPFDSRTPPESQGYQRLTVYGHVSPAVAANTQVVMRIPNLRVTLAVNGRIVFSWGDVRPAFMQSGGDVWTAFTSTGIRESDAVVLTLESLYPGPTLSSFRRFFDSLATGSEHMAFQAALSGQIINIVASAGIMLLGLIMLGMSLYARALRLRRAADYVFLSAFVFASGVWTGINYEFISLIVPYPAFTLTLEMLCMALLPVFLLRYLRALLAARYARVGTAALYGVLAAALVGVLLQTFGLIDLSLLTGAFVLVDVLAITALTYSLIRTIRTHCEPEVRREVMPLFILFGGTLLNFASYLFHWRTQGLFYALAFLLFSAFETLRLLQTLRETLRRNSEYMKLENELTQSRIAVMLSQIKPHFLFNALNAISALCLTDPIMADQAITSLSNYLRGNIRSLEQRAPVPFEQELDHIKYYVRLEQLRYGEKLRVVYAINTVDFQVPTLSLQTLVENAIRHGVSPKPEGGLVVVNTERGEGEAIVRIIDNGVGFDPDMQSPNADSIGLANAKKRMESMMGATFIIHSKPGKGTTVEIHMPDLKGIAPHEDTLRG
jgi:signal transduction histidine kinase